jgi:PAS domain S-box-containing protein
VFTARARPRDEPLSVNHPSAPAPHDGGSAAREEHLRRQLETIAQNATLALFIMDEHQQCTFMNPAAERLTGYALAEVRGRALHDVIHHTRPDGSPYPLAECPIDQAFPQNMREQGEEVFVHRDGHFYPVAFTASPIRDGGRTVGTIIEVRDITDERRMRREREATEARLHSVFQQAPAFMATVHGPDHTYELVNPAYHRLAGGRPILGRPVHEAMPELAEQGLVELLDRVYETGIPFSATEMRVLLRPAADEPPQERFLNFVYQPLADREGQIFGVLVHGVDVTDVARARRQAEEQAILLEEQAEAVRRQAEQLRDVQAELKAANEELMEANADLISRAQETAAARRAAEDASAALDAFNQAAPLPTALVDRDFRFLRINAALAAFYGLPVDQVVGRTLREVIPGYAHRVEPNFRHVLETGEALYNLEMVVPSRTEPGGERAVLLNYFPVRAGTGEVAGVGFIGLDVTERHAVERARREQAMTVESLHQVGQALASELTLDRIVQVVTDAATRLTGAEFGAFFYNLINEKGESYTLYSISGVPREKFSRFPMPRATAVFQPTFHGTEVVRSDDITRDPRYGRTAPHFGMPAGHLPVTSYLAVPVISRTGEVLGGLFFGHERAAVFQERHERLAVGIAGWAAVAMDNARLYEAEHRARAEAERANRVKSEFLTTMSHELRTPLNAMIGYTGLLLEGVPEPISPGVAGKVERIGISARHLLALIEEILTFSRLEAGEERLELSTVRLPELLDEVQALTEPLAMAKGLEFTCHAPDGPDIMQSDVRKIRQILVNLLGNAIKFTREGQVRLDVEEVADWMVFRVSDTGPGIAEEHRVRIFDAFWQVDGGTTRQEGGTGLGLSVTRRLAVLLGGTVEVESQVGRGTTFTVRLPLHAPASPA